MTTPFADRTLAGMIRNVVIHIANEQPMVADLFELPDRTDLGVLCTNLRMVDGKRPVSVDRIDGMFFFPFLHIRFLEIPPTTIDGSTGLPPMALDRGESAPAPTREPELDLEIEIDEDFLRRVREA